MKSPDSRPRRTVASSRRPYQRGILAGLFVVALGGVALYFIIGGRGATRPTAPTAKRNVQIATVAPHIVTNAPAKPPEDPHKGMVKVRGKWYPEYDKKGGRIWVTKYAVRYHTPVVITNRQNVANVPPACKLFTNRADRDIAQMLTCPLGSVVLGDWKYDERFVKQFLKSLETPITVSPDDDEWAAEVKRSVNATKIELKVRYDAGEDIAEIMNESRRELQQLGVYKMQLQNEVRKQLAEKNGNSQDAKDIYDAANKLLAAKGIAPLKMPSVLVRNLKIESTKKGNQQKKGKSHE